MRFNYSCWSNFSGDLTLFYIVAIINAYQYVDDGFANLLR